MQPDHHELESRFRTLETNVNFLRDRAAIQDVIHRYCRAADRCDLEAFKSCYWSDGFDDHGFFGGNAWDFCNYVIPELRKIDRSVHSITNTLIELDGARAYCESQWSVVHRLRDADRLYDYWHQGRYLDIFEKRDGEWRIFLRLLVADCDRLITTADIRAIAAEFGGQEAIDHQPLPGARAPDDPVCRGRAIADAVKRRAAMPDLWGGFYALGRVLAV
jgi:hypothetical protein